MSEAPRDASGKFIAGHHYHPETEFKKGEHWRPEKPFWNREWLYNEYVIKEQSSGDIAERFGVTDGAILFWLRKHKIKRRDVSEAREIKHWGLSGEQNGMYGVKGEDHPNWMGGVTPERQAFYSSPKWSTAARKVWKRDKGKCQRCGIGKKERQLHIHHIVSFRVKRLRCDANNLILLCDKCHRWVHGRQNINKEFIKKEVRGAANK